jgi:hypothetical protein
VEGVPEMTSWYDKPTTEAPIFEIDTPLGVMTIRPQADGYSVYCELKTLITIHRVTYKAQGTYQLDTHAEEWRGGLYPRRAKALPVTNAAGQDFKILDDCFPTKAACKAVDVVDDVFKAWAENNFNKLIQGKQAALQQLIERGNHRLDDIIASVNQRREELEVLAKTLQQSGNLPDVSRQMLEDVWGRHWRF